MHFNLIRKNSHGKILREKLKEQHLNTVSKSYPNQNSIRSYDIDGELKMTPLMVSSLVFVGFEFQPMKQTKYRPNINGLTFIRAIIYNW